MKIAQSLPKPQNWYDLETLCKKLWGDVWECPEIKKNGIKLSIFQILKKIGFFLKKIINYFM